MQQTPIFKTLPLLTELEHKINAAFPRVFSRVFFICAQHLLESTGTLIETLIRLGASAENITVLGKSYSANEGVALKLLKLGVNVRVDRDDGKYVGFSKMFDRSAEHLLDRVEKRIKQEYIQNMRSERKPKIIILDDGGHCIRAVRSSLCNLADVVGVEQTTSGMRKLESSAAIPVVNVALSAAKTKIESPLIAEAITTKVGSNLAPRGSRCGIIGYGNIGKALARVLLSRGCAVYAFDERTLGSLTGIISCSTIGELIQRCDFIFGCTGEDALGTQWIAHTTDHKTFLSCSSEDREFRSLLEKIYRVRSRGVIKDPTENVEAQLGRLSVTVVRGGFPVNFDRQAESVPSEDIQITRGLLLGAMLQSYFSKSISKNQMLDPECQRFLVGHWFKCRLKERATLFDQDTISIFKDTRRIKSFSAGDFAPSSAMNKIFAVRQKDPLKTDS